ncbi:MAG: YggT family protein [Dehalococcoidales bacterium]
MTYVFNFIELLCEVLTLAIFVRVILSWFITRPNMLTSILDKITDPILAPLRRIIPRAGMFDFSPLVAIILLQVIARLIP